MLIILDRDGVINEDSPNYIKHPGEWKTINGSVQAIVKLKQAGHRVCIATNQSGIARGYYTIETLDQIHQLLINELKKFNTEIDAIFYCPHTDEDLCLCRKPKPGMLLQAQKKFNISGDNTVFIGDSYRDFQAAQAAQCKFILVATGNGLKTKQKHNLDTPYYKDLAHVLLPQT
jgi:D-glycero-D-manno-heptose 1,7-bisphosphate phosphatase